MLLELQKQDLVKQIEHILDQDDVEPVPVYGGMTQYEQKLALSKGAHVVVCTPGWCTRLTDLLRKNITNCFRTTNNIFSFRYGF